jgi:hypothetical protein
MYSAFDGSVGWSGSGMYPNEISSGRRSFFCTDFGTSRPTIHAESSSWQGYWPHVPSRAVGTQC